MVDPVEIEHIVRDVLQRSQLWSRSAENLLLFTGMVESNYNQLIQGNHNFGRARSFWQVEPQTAIDNFENYLNFSFKNDLKNRVLKTANLKYTNINRSNAGYLLTTNIAFAILMCRIRYWRISEPIPNDLGDLAHYWKDYYNTKHGEGKISDFVEKAKKLSEML